MRVILGIILILIAAASLLLGVIGVYQVWNLRQPVIENAIATLDLLDSTLTTTATGLGIIKTSLQSVTTTVGSVQSTVATTSQAIADASGAVDSLSTIVGQNLAETVNTALGSLDALENTTQVIDEFLTGLAGLPFMNLNYRPEKPLSASVAELSKNLSQVPQSLTSLETNLKTSGQSLTKTSNEAKRLAVNLGQVQADLAKLTAVIDQYADQVAAFQKTVKSLRANIETIVTGGAASLTFILFWIGVTQVMVLLKGLELIGFRVFI